MIVNMVQPLTRPILSSLTDAITAALGGFNPTSLFADGSIGVLYDNNDLTTMFVDAAGTTPATVNGLVGLQLDKSQAQIVARRNLLDYTEQFDNAYWTKQRASVTQNTDTAPDGTLSADTLLATSADANVFRSQSGTAGTHVFSIWVKRKTGTGTVSLKIGATTQEISVTGSWQRFSASGNSNAFPGVNLATLGDEVYIWGAQLEIAASASEYQRVVTGYGDWMAGNHRYQTTTGFKPVLRGTPTGAELFTAYGTPGAGWSVAGATGTATTASSALPTTTAAVVGKHYRVTYTVTRSAGSVQLSFGGRTGVSRSAAGQYVEYFDNALNTNALTATGTGFTGTVRIDEVKDVSAGSVTAPYGLQYDGVDDFLQTASVNFTATDKMFVCAGVRKLSDSAGAVLVEIGTNPNSVNGSFNVLAPLSVAPNYGSALRGDTATNAIVATSFAAPNTSVLSISYNIAEALAANEITMRVNGVATGTAAGPAAGGGNFSNLPFYFGRRAGTSAPYNGLDFGFVIVGKTLTAAQISSTERYIAQRTGVSI